MQTISATYRVTTPMFLGGADPRGAPELRVPSIKGLLRFWWRAIRWSDFLAQCQNDKSAAFTELRKSEDALFGSIRTGQSSFLMSAAWAAAGSESPKVQSTWPPNQAFGSGYLGYGITESKRQALTHRTGWSEGCSFTVKCAFPKRAGEASQMVDARLKEINLAIRSLGMFGGLGARSRRGFGSVALNKVDQGPVNVETRDSLIQQINSLIPKTANGTELPPFTAFSRHAQVRLFDPDPKNFPARKVHDLLGESYRSFRGQPGRLRGASKRPMGLPLAGVDTARRRASPLVMHIHPVSSGHLGIVTFLPSEFHPDIPEGNTPKFFDVVHDWLNQLEKVQ
jgi:CRISPR-associated protein Cmr1